MRCYSFKGSKVTLGGGFGDFEDDGDDDNGSSYSFDGFEEQDDGGNDDVGFDEDISDHQQQRYEFKTFNVTPIIGHLSWSS